MSPSMWVKHDGFYLLQAKGYAFTEAQFTLKYWQDRPGFATMRGGRGSSCMIQANGLRAILRPYRRGGYVGRFLHDQYIWCGKLMSRPWREWRVMQSARNAGLPVPEPLAACIWRRGLMYRAALITAYLDDTEMLTLRLRRESLPRAGWQRLGVLIRDLHLQGIRHADLNSDNILIDSSDRFYLLDFDKARILKTLDDWQWQPLHRLQRSIYKRDRNLKLHFNDDDWQALMDGYQGNADQTY